MAKTIFYSLAALVRKILFLPLENKIHIFAPPCNILYISPYENVSENGCIYIYIYIFFITNFSRCCGWLRFAAQPKLFLFLVWASRRLFCHNNNKLIVENGGKHLASLTSLLYLPREEGVEACDQSNTSTRSLKSNRY